MHIKNDEVTHMLKVDTFKFFSITLQMCEQPLLSMNPHLEEGYIHGYKGRYPSNTRHIF
jgi:hypothetical protein